MGSFVRTSIVTENEGLLIPSFGSNVESARQYQQLHQPIFWILAWFPDIDNESISKFTTYLILLADRQELVQRLTVWQ
jgi:hypothetical protein